MTRPLIIYHASCTDGFCCAWIAHKVFGTLADYHAANHGEPPPDAGGREVYILDFSYKRDVLRRLISLNQRVVVLDHHRTAEAELADLNTGDGKFLAVFDMNKSGGRLTWEFFFTGRASPWLVDYTEDRDLWRWALPKSREISAFIASHPFDFDRWDDLANVYPQSSVGLWPSLVNQGAAILRYQQQQIDSQVKHAREIDLAGHKILAVNATHLTSEIAGKLAEGKPFGACWFVRADGRKVWSLRSRDGGVDVSEIARQFGGGGHRNAAGFEVP